MDRVPQTIRVNVANTKAKLAVSVIIPARNEGLSLGACLRSLVAQARETNITEFDGHTRPSLVSDEGVQYEIIVVDDSSTDDTHVVAASFDGVQLVCAAPLRPGWCGKSNACYTGAAMARGKWLLFTDADTIHGPGALARSMAEAEAHEAALLSYSPRQQVETFAEHLLMPLIFAELACTYRPRQVCDPASPIAAANGQFLLIRRDAYDSVGGHAAVAGDLLEDVALARLVKQSGRRLRFRYAGELVETRMYRSFAQLREGWTKNLALLFPSPAKLALLRFVEFLAGVGGATTAIVALAAGAHAVATVSAAIAVPT